MIELTPEVILEAKAKRFAIKHHGSQMYGDVSYEYHLNQVVQNVKIRKAGDPMLSIYVAVAWLHDTLEDTDATFEQIEREFGLAIAYAVRCLTKTEGESYERYIQSCIDCAVAREVKICDTLANMLESFKSSGSNDPDVSAKGFRGLAKYPKQLWMLVDGEVK
ncbi:putative phosphohydrolase [Pseudomonas phage UAVern]|uniref:Phosphohydrolase n=1 Tax=Pseudomonas phage UAVern TaxID=2856997 RepID=A0A975UUF7_9CAUD|nr:putative phosphohydrolase [Pseudomonas phage UAVern]